MAISLNRVQQNAKRSARKQKSKSTIMAKSPKEAARPWAMPQIADPVAAAHAKLNWPPLSQDPLINFEAEVNLRLLPDDVEAASSSVLLGVFAKRLMELQWRRLQRRSYWVSRVTHRNSWWSRVKLYPEMKVPLPSWLTQRRNLDAT